MTFRRAAIGLAVLAMALMLVSTGGFSAMHADRGVHVEVVGDNEALVGYESPNPIKVTGAWTDADGNVTDASNAAGPVSEHADLVTITNRAGAPIEHVEVSSYETPDGIELEDIRTPDSIGVGDEGTISATVVCESSTAGSSHDIAVTVTLRNDHFVSIIYGDTRTITVECPA